jgi:hypothetical protein
MSISSHALRSLQRNANDHRTPATLSTDKNVGWDLISQNN